MVLKPLIRREFKNRWEGRAPLSPEAVVLLGGKGVEVLIEPYEHRCYADEDYLAAGARLCTDSHEARLVLGIKEPKLEQVSEGQIHLCFSHTIKGQTYNMGLLRHFMDMGATLIDYEIMKDVQGRRTIAFGRYAGIAGAVDTFHVAGRKWSARGKHSVLEAVEMTHRYGTIATLRERLGKLDPERGDFGPRVLVVGTGNVARGAIEVCEWLGLPRIFLAEMLNEDRPGPWFTVAATRDIVRRKDGGEYDKAEYRRYGRERYQNDFGRYLGRFDILLHTPYWTDKYPRLLDRDTLTERGADLPPVIGDISCDIEGSIACTLRESTIDEPAYTYDLAEHIIRDGISEEGPTVMAIGHLPSELSVDATNHFSAILIEKMSELTEIDLDKPLESSGLRRELREATIVYKGELTERYAYLAEMLARAGV